MTYKLEISDDAEQDVDDIMAYITQKLKNVQAARELYKAIKNTYSQIIENPFMFGLFLDESLNKKGYRRAVVKNYLIAYRVVDESVYIVRVFYGARDYTKLL